jgi:hypothetical protein
MHRIRGAIIVCGLIGLAFLHAMTGASAQSALNRLPPARAPCSVLSGRPCHPSFCGVFHGGPCFPQYLPPIGEDLRLTIVSSDDNDAASNPAGDANKSGDDADKTADEKPLDSISELYAALRACWVAPPKDETRHGMEYTIRRPIAIRFVDNRSTL